MIPTVSVSKMTGKLEGIQAINTNTATNEFCIKESSKPDADKICGKCYSMSMLSSYRKNCQPAFQRNSDVLASDAEFILPRTSGAFVRFHGHVELINDPHFLNLCDIAESNGHCTFALWTKRVDIVRPNRHHVPENMILVYSNPKIDNVMSSTAWVRPCIQQRVGVVVKLTALDRSVSTASCATSSTRHQSLSSTLNSRVERRCNLNAFN